MGWCVRELVYFIIYDRKYIAYILERNIETNSDINIYVIINAYYMKFIKNDLFSISQVKKIRYSCT